MGRGTGVAGPAAPAGPHDGRRIARSGAAALLAVLLGVLVTAGTSGADPVERFPFQDPRLPAGQRIDDLLGRLTLDEKLSLLHQSQPAIPRLGVDYFKTGTEALHGVAWSNDVDDNWNVVTATGATVFPQALGLASTWDPELVRRVGAAVGDEVRGHHAADPTVWGLQVWAPVVNLLRDPRWGKNEEGYSEDPLLTGAISTAYGRGLSGDDPERLKTAPVLKHYAAYNREADRSLTSANLRPRLRHEYEGAAFRPAIAAGAATGVMAGYNLVNGRPSHVNPDFTEVIRSWTDRDLYHVSDAWAPHALTQLQGYYADETEAYAAMLRAGLDSFTVDDGQPAPMMATLRAALDRGLLTVADLDASVRRVLSIRLRLGHFDPDGGPYARIGPEVIGSPAHRRLNREAAERAMVLLRNSAGTLPLDPNRVRNVAVIGPLHDALHGDWYGGALPYRVTPLDGIRERLGDRARVTAVEALDRVALRDRATGRYLTATGTAPGQNVVAAPGPATAAARWDQNDWAGDVSTLRNAGNGRYLAGNWGPYHTAETEIGGWFVPQQFALERQPDGAYLIRYAGYETNESWWPYPGRYLTVSPDGAVGTGDRAAAARFDREVVESGAATAAEAAARADAVVVVVGSHPLVYGRENSDRRSLALGAGQSALVEAVSSVNPATAVVLETSYPVTLAAEPATLLWTTHAGPETGHALAATLFGDRNPGGRLSQTWPRTDADLPADLLDYDIIRSGQTYLYRRGDPLFPFGHGLSYTRFRHADLRVSAPSVEPEDAVTVTVAVTNTGRRTGDEVVQLYTRQRTSRDRMPLRQLRAFDRLTLAPGQTRRVTFTLRAADLGHWDVTRNRWVVESAEHDLLVGASATDIRQRGTLRVHGETIPARDLSRPTRAENFDDHSGILLVDESKPRGTAVEGGAGSGGWLAFTGTALDARSGTLTVRAASSAPGDATVEVRLDSPTGPLLGRATVPSTGDRYAYTTVDAALAATTGVRDVYLRLDAGLRLSEFSIGPATGRAGQGIGCSPSCRTVQLPSSGKPGVDRPASASEPRAISATAASSPPLPGR
ncbi:glycoside hydrolase family 3 C-terminal domain-containing protein [Plantactinospora veratri]|uniref:Glycoside hydrolase family 3 C-terminal domain-containing protein n=1 Tax=Plantactinospora veratri TaxID=1436122 RepID=A0ABU7SEY2_9ACTN